MKELKLISAFIFKKNTRRKIFFDYEFRIDERQKKFTCSLLEYVPVYISA